ncbi:MAG: hypothetical protein RL710_500, partial [Pseudomonadota bacterium]
VEEKQYVTAGSSTFALARGICKKGEYKTNNT